MAVHQLEITTENLLDAVVRMPESDFNRFIKKARQLRRNGEDKKNISPAQADLLQKINNLYPADKRRRYNELYAKFKDENLAKGEYEELSELNNDFEMLDAKRIGYIGELAKLRGQTIEQVMDFFEIGKSKNG
jgi:hypothetical protein